LLKEIKHIGSNSAATWNKHTSSNGAATLATLSQFFILIHLPSNSTVLSEIDIVSRSPVGRIDEFTQPLTCMTSENREKIHIFLWTTIRGQSMNTSTWRNIRISQT
jgi:hypothetical protein